MPSLVALAQAQGATRPLSLSFVDMLITVEYVLLALRIGFYLKRLTKTGDDFFLAGKQPMIAGRICAQRFGGDC
jgi:hypothetical protein